MCTAWGDKLHQEFNSLSPIFLTFVPITRSGALSRIKNAGNLINFRYEAVLQTSLFGIKLGKTISFRN